MNLTEPTPILGELSPLEVPTKRGRKVGGIKHDFGGEPVTENTGHANRHHDRTYGWVKTFPREYTNLARRSEYVKVPPGLKTDEEVWAALFRAQGTRLAARSLLALASEETA